MPVRAEASGVQHSGLDPREILRQRAGLKGVFTAGTVASAK
jgi:hypothetical protein